MAGLLRDIRRLNALSHTALAEPFAGGAGASLKLLYLEETHRIHINDADPAIYDFWHSVVNRPEPFLDMLSRTRASMAEWERQKAAYMSTTRLSQLRRGFAAFYLNRCNRSGIIVNGGPIGGVKQTGKWKIGARFNKNKLAERCSRLAEYQDRIQISCEDGLHFIDGLNVNEAFFFIDPPYFEKGPTLYLNGLDIAYHTSLAERLRQMGDAAWVLTYDDCPQIRRMYRGWARVRPFSIRYTAARRRSGNEVMITPLWMRLPTAQASLSVDW